MSGKMMLLIVLCFGIFSGYMISNPTIKITSGYVTEKSYDCRGLVTIINDIPYCNESAMSCRITIGDWVNGEFHQSVVTYNDTQLCAIIKLNDHIPYLSK